MKPLRLQFSGLNSYRETQTVDFVKLGSAGLFGIFGPTGSGKSTILDAITLALFGAVDRSPRNVRGIINQQEDSAEVSFTFELGGTEYTVQRRYDKNRNDPGSAHAKYARLTAGDGKALAATPRETNDKVQSLLGLTQEEFARAVVLPQGKFDQFLRLTGSERAEMLERIFDLGRYGETLRQRAVARRERLQGRLGEIDAAEKELGDCSDAAVQAASREVTGKEASLAEVAERLRKTGEAHTEQSALRDLHAELSVANFEKAELDLARPGIEAYQVALDLTKRAEPLRQPIEQVQRGQESRSRLSADLASVEARLNAAAAGHQAAVAALDAADKRREMEEPSLRERKARLADAVKVKADLTGLKRQESTLAAQIDETDRLLERSIHAEAGCRQSKAELDEKMAGLDSRRSTLSIDPSSRRLVEAAHSAIAPVESTSKLLSQAEVALTQKERETAKQGQRVLESFDRLSSVSARRYAFSDSGELVAGVVTGVVASGEDLAVRAASEVDIAQALVAEADRRLRQALIRDQAALLASHLGDGKPCPVCGSLDHPSPASGEDSCASAAESALKTASDCLTGVRSWRDELSGHVLSWGNSSRNETEAWEVLDERKKSLEQATQAFRGALEAALASGVHELLAVPAPAFDVAAAMETVKRARDNRSARDALLYALTRESDAAQKDRQVMESRLAGLASEIADLRAKKAGLAASVSGVRDQIARDSERLVALCGGDDPEVLLTRVEATILDIQQRITVARAAGETARTSKESLDRQAVGLKSTLAQVVTELEAQKAGLERDLVAAGFVDATGAARVTSAKDAMLPPADSRSLQQKVDSYRDEVLKVGEEIKRVAARIAGRAFSEQAFQDLVASLEAAKSEFQDLQGATAVARDRLASLKEHRTRWDELERERGQKEKARDVADRLVRLVQGRRLVQFLAEEHLADMTLEASERLGSLTGQRYALEIARGPAGAPAGGIPAGGAPGSVTGEFVIRDDFNGGERRAVSTLSGGETFLTSLALALALSSKIQLRGQYPLGFFFLDEGFGTLDDERLELVMGALEKVRDKERMVGVISHVKELRDRLPYYLEVVPAKDDGSGSRIVMRR